MSRKTSPVLAFLVAAPLFLGASTAPKKADKQDLTPIPVAETTVPPVSDQPLEVEQFAPAIPIGDDASVPSSAPAAGAALYEIDWYSINGGGTVNATSPSYRLGASIGQSVAGSASSPSYQMGIGFWYGAGGSASCTCPCASDPQCDGIISNVQDVVITINVAFRGVAGVMDAGCPNERTDVDANGVTSVTDVVKVINVAFRGQTAAANYVDPCL